MGRDAVVGVGRGRVTSGGAARAARTEGLGGEGGGEEEGVEQGEGEDEEEDEAVRDEWRRRLLGLLIDRLLRWLDALWLRRPRALPLTLWLLRLRAAGRKRQRRKVWGGQPASRRVMTEMRWVHG